MSGDVRRARWRSTRVRWALVVTLVLVIPTLLGSWAWQARFPPMKAGGGGYGMGSAPSRAATTIGLPLCLEGDARARVVAVRPVRVRNGLRVVAFGVNTSGKDLVGTVDDPVSDLPAFQGEHVVDDCEDGTDDLAVQVAAPTYPASADGFEIEYVVHGLTRTARSGGSIDLYPGPIPEDW